MTAIATLHAPMSRIRSQRWHSREGYDEENVGEAMLFAQSVKERHAELKITDLPAPRHRRLTHVLIECEFHSRVRPRAILETRVSENDRFHRFIPGSGVQQNARGSAVHICLMQEPPAESPVAGDVLKNAAAQLGEDVGWQVQAERLIE